MFFVDISMELVLFFFNKSALFLACEKQNFELFNFYYKVEKLILIKKVFEVAYIS